MDARTEEYARRAVQLRNDNALCTIYNKGTVLGHVGDRTEENILDDGAEILVVGVGTIKFEFGLQGHTIGQSALKTFLDTIARRVDIVIQEFQHKVVASISDREVLSKNFVQAIVFTQFRRSVKLQEILEGL